MTNELKIERQIRRWNKFFSFFGLCIAIVDRRQFCGILNLSAVVAVMSTLIFLQFSRADSPFKIIDENGVVRLVHMLGNVMVIFQLLQTLQKMKECSNIHRKFKMLEKYGGWDVSTMVKGYFLLPITNLTFFVLMDAAEYVFFECGINSIDVVPVISGHFLILYNILHVLNFSIHLSWLGRLLALVNFELRCTVTRLSDKTKGEHVKNDSKVWLKSSFSLQLKESDERRKETVDTLKKIRLCRYLYNEAYRISNDINKAYETRNLILVSFNVIVGIIFLAPAVSDIITILTRRIDSSFGSENIAVEFIMFRCRWSITCFLTVYALIWATRLTLSEVHRAPLFVYDMLMFRLNAKVKAELQRFSVQLLQSKVKFAPHQFFTLNNELCLSIMDTFIFYLVVMFQLSI